MERLEYIEYLVNECGYLPNEAEEAVKAIEDMKVEINERCREN